jgi:hypothetical protein
VRAAVTGLALLALLPGTPAAAGEPPGPVTPTGEAEAEGEGSEADEAEEEEQDDDSPEAKARRLEAERRAVERVLDRPLEQRFEEYLNSPYNTLGRSFAWYLYDSARDLRNAGIGLAIASPVLAGGGLGVFFGLQGSSFEGRVSGGAVMWAASAACLGAGAALWLVFGGDVDRLAPLVGRGERATRAPGPFVAPMADDEGRRGLVVGFSF